MNPSSTPIRDPEFAAVIQQPNETEFEKRRGVSRIEMRRDLVLAEVAPISDPLTPSRLNVLSTVARAGISLDFLKLTAAGLSFLVRLADADRLEAALAECGQPYHVLRNRSLVTIYAVNMRDEEGLIASLVSTAIASGAAIDHLSDMHDRLLIGCPDEDAARIVEAIDTQFIGGSA